jgi:hypothetical protein
MITLISKENAPAGLTLYLAIDLNNGAKAMTGVYFPDGYPGDKKLDLILYLHGHDAPPINEYWKQKQFKLREEVNDGNKWLALIAPTLGAKSQSGSLTSLGLDWYLDRVIEGVFQHAPEKVGQSATPSVGNIFLACHSGGGEPMRKLAWEAGSFVRKYGGKVRECWGFDCLYHPSNNPFKKEAPTENTSDTEENWFYWAQLNPQAKLFVYYTDQGGTKTRSENLERFVKNDPRFNINLGFGNINRGNVIVSKSDTPAHNDVPKRYLKERVNACVLR